MNKRLLIQLIGLILIVFSFWKVLSHKLSPDEFLEITKIALRDVGNELLLADNDSTSVILPVIEEEPLKYKLSFQNELAIVPDSLVNQVRRSLDKANLPTYYRVEVKQCSDDEVSYSYEMRDTQENGIVPCGGRLIKEGCYYIVFRFLGMTNKTTGSSFLNYFLSLIGLALVLIGFKKQKQTAIHSTDGLITLGGFNFYPEQNKLVKHPETINLSKKECEILALFVERPNQIIKRDELTKAVWEDNGVFVGRSLDTYISKLRKKLQSDDSVKLTNVHGVGYKLEINQN
jgi:hypothetical protein